LVPLAIAGGFLFIVAIGIILIAIFVLPAGPDPAPVVADAGAETRPIEVAPNGRLPDEAVDRVKRATVYIRVTMSGPRGQAVGSGSGFLVTRDGHLITNPHVISPPPELPGARVRKIEVVFRSGEPDSFTADATVVRADPGPDLALLRVPALGLPDPVPIGDSTGLRETHDVYIFGFPLGEQLGRAITVSKSSVSSLRRDRRWPEIQVNGGMHPGNSGGPVTDASGRVVGVAVAGIVGTQLNFAIPAETVRTFIQSAENRDPVVGGPPIPPAREPGVAEPPKRPRIDPPPRPARGPAAKIQTPAGTRPTQILGGAFDPEYYDKGPDGSLLVGLEIGLGTFINYDVIRAVRPIYRRDGKDSLGKQRGTELDRIVKVVAKPGYAVAGLSIKAGLGLDSMSITFMKVVDGKLDRSDSYESQRIGGPGGGGPVMVGGDGSLVFGIVGKSSEQHATGLGLLLGPQPPPKDPTIIAGGFAPLFRDLAPKGGVLIGLEIGLGKFFDEDVIKAVRPIYRVSGRELFGEQRGVRPRAAITIKAKDGYAVGAMTCKSGLNFDGCSLTFMKVVGGKLDPTDSYESEWVGWNGNKGTTRIESDGTPVVGIAGRGSDREVNGLGLLFKGQEDFDPAAGRR
jgi:S1-C subfamily serine protease